MRSRKRLLRRFRRILPGTPGRIGIVPDAADNEIEDVEEVEDAPASDAEGDVEHYHFRVGKNLARRIDQYLVDRVPYLSRNNVQRLIDLDLVKVNGRPTKASYKLKGGDEVEMVAPPKPVNELVPEPIPLDTDYASVIRADVPIVVQHTRLDSRQGENALLSTIAFPA